MAVPALELRPRKTVALFDAALRLCARSSGVWSVTLPAGACVIAALFSLVDAVTHHRALLTPVALFTAAWLFRAVSMGAACHFLQVQVLGNVEANAWSSFAAALKRAPSLIITAAFTAFFNTLIWTLTLGIGFLFLGAHNVAYAVAMRGQGHPLAVYATASKLLGPARHTAAWVRLCGLSQALVLLNLHLVTIAIFYLGKSLLALDLTFVQRFASLDNATWLAALMATTFTLFEPLRAATATLLLIDGRVRQEALDLLATLEQLPRRKRPRPSTAVALGLGLLLLSTGARAQDDWSGVYTPGRADEPPAASPNLKERLEAVVDQCNLSKRVSSEQLRAVGQLSPEDQSSLSRFVARIERLVWDDEDCKAAAADLQRGLALIAQTRRLEQDSSASTRDEAKAILTRPEFRASDAVEKTRPEEEEGPSGFSKAWAAFWEAISKWLRGLQSDPEPKADLGGSKFGGMGFANGVVVLAVLGVISFLLWLLIRGRDKGKAVDADAFVSSLNHGALSTDPMSALARAPESWAGLADQLAREGKYREAIRHLYLALLSHLHRIGGIDYDPAKSNWDYFRGFKGRPSVLGPFRELTLRFDFAWYGNLEGSQTAWTAFRSLCEPILAPDSEGMTAGA